MRQVPASADSGCFSGDGEEKAAQAVPARVMLGVMEEGLGRGRAGRAGPLRYR